MMKQTTWTIASAFLCVSKIGTTFVIYILHGILTSQKNRHDFTLFLYPFPYFGVKQESRIQQDKTFAWICLNYMFKQLTQAVLNQLNAIFSCFKVDRPLTLNAATFHSHVPDHPIEGLQRFLPHWSAWQSLAEKRDPQPHIQYFCILFRDKWIGKSKI